MKSRAVWSWCLSFLCICECMHHACAHRRQRRTWESSCITCLIPLRQSVTVPGASRFGVDRLTSKPQPSSCLCPSSAVLGSQAQACLPRKKKRKNISYQLSHLPSPMYLVCNPCPSCDVEAVRLMAGPVLLSCEIHADDAESGLVPARLQLSTSLSWSLAKVSPELQWALSSPVCSTTSLSSTMVPDFDQHTLPLWRLLHSRRELWPQLLVIFFKHVNTMHSHSNSTCHIPDAWPTKSLLFFSVKP